MGVQALRWAMTGTAASHLFERYATSPAFSDRTLSGWLTISLFRQPSRLVASMRRD